MSPENLQSKAKIFAQMLLREEFSSEEEMEKWLQDQAVGYVQRELIAIMGTGLLTEELVRMAKEALQMSLEQPLEREFGVHPRT